MASDDLADKPATMTGLADDLLDRDASLTSAMMSALVSSRRRYPSYWSFSAQVSRVGLIVVAPIAVLIARIDLRTASRKAALAFSKRCQRSAT